MSVTSVSGINKKMGQIPNRYDDDDVTPPSERCCHCGQSKLRPGPKIAEVIQRNKYLNCCWKFLAFPLSNIGIICLVTGYYIIGGCMMEQRSRLERKRQQSIDELCIYIESTNILNDDDLDQRHKEEVRAFQSTMCKAVQKEGLDGSDDTTTGKLQSSFAQVLLDSITHMTNIGYAHIAPKSVAGQFIAIPYTMGCILLTLLFKEILGNVLASCFRSFYTYVLCCMYCDKKKTKEEPSVTAIRSEIAPPLLHPIAPDSD